MNTEFNPRFLRRYAQLGELIPEAIRQYVSDVRAQKFPHDQERSNGSEHVVEYRAHQALLPEDGLRNGHPGVCFGLMSEVSSRVPRDTPAFAGGKGFARGQYKGSKIFT
jgi:hypothetical protein